MRNHAASTHIVTLQHHKTYIIYSEAMLSMTLRHDNNDRCATKSLAINYKIKTNSKTSSVRTKHWCSTPHINQYAPRTSYALPLSLGSHFNELRAAGCAARTRNVKCKQCALSIFDFIFKVYDFFISENGHIDPARFEGIHVSFSSEIT